MTGKRIATIDGNTAAATVAYACSEVIAIYPITPSTPMGELSDTFSATGKPNLWGLVPSVTEMQSEGGAAGAVHGALTAGAVTTTFTASQGLLLMIPNMFKIAGELTPAVFHVSARAIAAQGLSIFGDHSDVMAVRSTGWCQLASNSVQEAMDMALIAHAATLRCRLPFIHFFDGFRTSHEIQTIEMLDEADMRALIDDELMAAHRARGLSPDHPAIRGTAQNPDVYFQGRESVNSAYDKAPEAIQLAMDQLAARTGRQYRLFDYYGDPEAERVIICMGSGAEVVHECVDRMNAAGDKVGLVKVRLFRPFVGEALRAAVPKTAQQIAVLDRCKEPGASGEPLYHDVVTAFMEGLNTDSIRTMPHIVGGRYGLGSKEFDPAMARAVFMNLQQDRPKNHFTIGIIDDVTHTSLDWQGDNPGDQESSAVDRAIFVGLGSDGTVGANKNSIKIIGKATGKNAQAYFVYDSKKSGSMTVSHLRFSDEPIRASYLIKQASFVACHAMPLLERYPILDYLQHGGTFLLNTASSTQRCWNDLPQSVQQTLIAKQARLFIIDAYGLAKELGLRGRINVIMQTAFFAISGILAENQAQELIEQTVKDTYASKGPKVVELNIRAARAARDHVHEIAIGDATSTMALRPPVIGDTPAFVQSVTGEIIAGRGDLLPVSAIPDDGTWPTGTSQFEKRAIAQQIPVWNQDICIQCNLCSLSCPHGTIRPKIYDKALANGASPAGWRSASVKGKGLADKTFTIQVAPEDCTGCGACVHVCPALERIDGKATGRKAIEMHDFHTVREREVVNWNYFTSLSAEQPASIPSTAVKGAS